MVWYRWKFWRFAWSLNPDAAVIDGSGQWHPLVGRLMWLTYPDVPLMPDGSVVGTPTNEELRAMCHGCPDPRLLEADEEKPW